MSHGQEPDRAVEVSSYRDRRRQIDEIVAAFL